MAILAHEYVLGLHVSVDDVEVVQVLNRQYYLAHVYSSLVLGEAVTSLFLENAREVATRTVFQNQKQLLLILKALLHLDDEWVLRDSGEYLLL